jgi:hypothetical protein
MIYACLRFIEEWAHPLTLAGFVLVGLSSGFLLAAAAARVAGEGELARCCGPAAFVLTLLAGSARLLALRRNARIRHRSTLQSATGIAATRLVQTSMGIRWLVRRAVLHRASAGDAAGRSAPRPSPRCRRSWRADLHHQRPGLAGPAPEAPGWSSTLVFSSPQAKHRKPVLPVVS